MTTDPYFSDVGDPKGVPTRPRRWVRRAVLYPLLTLSGCHMLLTCSPVPFWHVERLNRPVAVTALTEDALVLAGGWRVSLPFIKRLPKDDPVFLAALKHGVEVGESGELYGLIDPPRMCGNDPVVFYRMRANLSDLAGLMNPDGIDDSIVHPDEIRSMSEDDRRSPGPGGMPYGIMGQLARIRRVYEHHANRAKSSAFAHRPDGLE